MIKKFNDSLFIKIFMITVILLLCVSLSVFGLVAVLMPQTYSNELNSVLSRQTLNFIDELEMTALEDSGGLFDQFLENINIFSVELYDDNGQGITIPLFCQTVFTFPFSALEQSICLLFMARQHKWKSLGKYS